MSIEEQPAPTNGRGDMWGLVIEDMHKRRKMGIKRYGVVLQADNGRHALVDMYDEILDAAVYARQMLEENNINIVVHVPWYWRVWDGFNDACRWLYGRLFLAEGWER